MHHKQFRMSMRLEVFIGSSVIAALQRSAHLPRVLRFLRNAGISTAGAAGLSLALDVALLTIECRVSGGATAVPELICARSL